MSPTTRYAHNALGQRVFKTEPQYPPVAGDENDAGFMQSLINFFKQLWSPATAQAEGLGYVYAYDEQGSLIGEYGTGGAHSTGNKQYVYLPTAAGPMPIVVMGDDTRYAMVTDHLNTPRRATYPDGDLRWQWGYSAFGDEQPTISDRRFNKTTPLESDFAINLRYPGQYFDVESNLHYNGFRTYNPTIGRYTQGDPIGLEGGWNRFGYVGGNSLQRSDPLGLWSIDAGGFWGPGMNFTLGYDPGQQRGFFGMQFGYGVGGGIMYSPNGGLPTGQGPLIKCGDDQMFLEVFGKAGVSGIGANMDIVNANTGKGLTTGRPYGGLSWFDLSFGKKWGLKAEAAGGVQVMGVTRPNSNESCSCR